MSTQTTSQAKVVLGIDVGGTATNATVLDEHGNFLVDGMVEVPSRVTEGPAAAEQAVADVITLVLQTTGVDRSQVLAIGLDTPGPADAKGVISSLGATNFSDKEWWGYDIRAGVERHIGLPTIYNNDGNAAALYAHRQQLQMAGTEATRFLLDVTAFVERRGFKSYCGLIDSLAVAAAIDPSLFTREDVAVAVETTSELSRGQTIVDRRDHFRWQTLPTIKAASAVDTSTFFDLLTDSLCGTVQNARREASHA